MTTTHTLSRPQSASETLFAIAEHLYSLEALIFENDGEINQTIDDWLLEYRAKEEEKIDAYCHVIQRFEQIAAEAKRLSDRASRYRKSSTQLKSRLKEYLQMKGKDKYETARFTLRVSQNGGMQPVELTPGVTAEDLPEHFVKVVKEVDYTAIRDALLSGDESAGLFARLIPRGSHLRIR